MLKRIVLCGLLLAGSGMNLEDGHLQNDDEDPHISGYVIGWSGCDAVVSAYLLEWPECPDVLWTTNPGLFPGSYIRDTLEMWIHWRHPRGKDYPDRLPKNIYFCDSLRTLAFASDFIRE